MFLREMVCGGARLAPLTLPHSMSLKEIFSPHAFVIARTFRLDGLRLRLGPQAGIIASLLQTSAALQPFVVTCSLLMQLCVLPYLQFPSAHPDSHRLQHLLFACTRYLPNSLHAVIAFHLLPLPHPLLRTPLTFPARHFL